MRRKLITYYLLLLLSLPIYAPLDLRSEREYGWNAYFCQLRVQ